MRRPTFEEKLPIIEHEVNKRRGKWKLGAIRWMDWDDIKSQIITHIHKKWHLYDPSKKLENWVSTITSRQLINHFRNHYTNYARPCIKCKFAVGQDECLETPSGTQCSECPLYKKWEENKKLGYDIKFSLELENHSQEVFDKIDEGINFDLSIDRIKAELEKRIAPEKYTAFCWLFVEKKTETEVADMMNFKVHLRNKTICNNQMKELKDELLKEVKNIIRNCDILEYP